MKQTEIGLIPEDWEVKELNFLSNKIASGKSNTKNDLNGMYPIYGSTGIIGFKSYFDYEGDKITVARVGANAGTLNLIKGSYCISDNTLFVELKKEFCQKFVYKYLESINLNKYIFGSGQPLITGSILKNLQIPLPPLAEQEAIANALSDADAWIEKLEQLIAKKRLIKQGAMQTLLTPKDGWEVDCIKNVVSIPVTDGPHETPKFLKTGVPFLSVNNIIDNKISWDDLRYISEEDDIRYSMKCKPQKYDILLGKAASVGKVAIVDTDYDFNIWSPLALIRTKKIFPKYCFYFLQTGNVINQIKFLTNTSSQGNIGMGDIEKINISYPKSLSEQERIATILSDMDAEIEPLEQQLGKARHIKQGMMQELLTGRTRLV